METRFTTNFRIKQSLREFLDTKHWDKPLAATLTMKKALGGIDPIPIRMEDCIQNLRHALNVMNKKVYGNKGRRKKLRIEIIPALEKDSSGRFHYHLAINVPSHYPRLKFLFELRTLWPKTRWGYRETDIKFMDDEGWVHYLTKIDDVRTYNEKIDWANLHLAGQS